MRAITVSLGIADSARLDDIPEPPLSDGAIVARSLALGVCGTDREILSGAHGLAPPGQERLVLGYGAERFRIEPDFAVRIDPSLGLLGVLLEPASILAKAWDHTERWLARLITRRVPLERWSEALEYRRGDIKVIIDFVQ